MVTLLLETTFFILWSCVINFEMIQISANNWERWLFHSVVQSGWHPSQRVVRNCTCNTISEISERDQTCLRIIQWDDWRLRRRRQIVAGQGNYFDIYMCLDNVHRFEIFASDKKYIHAWGDFRTYTPFLNVR